MAIQIGKYKRPGIFIEEYDKSIISSPAIPEGINTMVIGFSKKGPFNTPVRLTNTGDLESIFGSIDRGLERKGSFFHRTVTKMLQSSPVYALSLLATNDELDRAQYQMLSASSDLSNGVLSDGPYRRFFNTTGFWKRDTDSFIDLTKDDSAFDNSVISLTNLSDKSVSVFIFKSGMGGFDRTLTEWYGTPEKVPSYLYDNDYASDYMVDVVVVGGDWSNYSTLSVDPRWSKYFDSTGLKKSMTSQFAYDRNVNLLAYYEGLSLIPYFRDGNGKNIFIESVINSETDKTGLFCAFNIDKVETDYPTGMIDLLGNKLVNVENSTIDFLSYNDTINEISSYSDVQLDRPGNAWGVIGTFSSDFRIPNPLTTYFTESTSEKWNASAFKYGENRTAIYSEGHVHGVTSSMVTGQGVTSSTVEFRLGVVAEDSTDGAFAVVSGTKVSISDTLSGIFTVDTSVMTATGSTYTAAFVLRSTGVVETVSGNLSGNDWTSYPSVGVNDFVLGYANIFVTDGGDFVPTYTDVYTNASGFVELTHTVDYQVTATASGIQVTFNDTADTPNVRNYEQYRKIRLFNTLRTYLLSGSKNKISMIVNTDQDKLSLVDVTVDNVITSTTYDKSFTLLGTGVATSDVLNGLLLFYYEDNEFVLGSDVVLTTDLKPTTTDGVASKYSKFYLDFYNGSINSGDYFYSNFISPEDEFNVIFDTYGATSYVIFESTSGSAVSNWPEYDLQSGDTMVFPTSNLNKGSYVIVDYTNVAGTGAVDNDYSGSQYYAFAVTQTVNYEYLPAVRTVLAANYKHYLKMFIDSSDNLEITFVDVDGVAEPLGSNIHELKNNSAILDVYSNKVNDKQTVEVVYPSGYTITPNKVLVDANRYSEVKVGDFLEAYYDGTNLQSGEVPRKLTRILSKKLYSGDTTLAEISCDSRIAVYNYGTSLNPDYQTTRYTVVEDYISTYKSITLSGFRVKTTSIPDGTESKQQEILNLVASGTPLFNALTNKEAIDFRYLVDSFGLGLIEYSKQQLVDICGSRLDCFGFINMPSMKQFKNSTSPTFVNSEGVLETAYIAEGGDPESNASFSYSFGTGAGTTCVGYFLPYLTIGDNGRPLDVPPAMFVATTYMRKQNSAITSIVPWTIAAGITNGRVTGFNNVEMDFTVADIENLNQAQMNPIVYKRNRGFVIETENTAQTLYKSALSYIHVREVLIELERELSRMLLDFQWKFNTPDIRAEIKLRADVICETYVSRNGLYNYFNKCDDENNTPDVIDSQIGVLDSYIEPIKGMGIIVNNITILRAGQIKSGGFISA